MFSRFDAFTVYLVLLLSCMYYYHTGFIVAVEQTMRNTSRTEKKVSIETECGERTTEQYNKDETAPISRKKTAFSLLIVHISRSKSSVYFFIAITSQRLHLSTTTMPVLLCGMFPSRAEVFLLLLYNSKYSYATAQLVCRSAG